MTISNTFIQQNTRKNVTSCVLFWSMERWINWIGRNIIYLLLGMFHQHFTHEIQTLFTIYMVLWSYCDLFVVHMQCVYLPLAHVQQFILTSFFIWSHIMMSHKVLKKIEEPLLNRPQPLSCTCLWYKWWLTLYVLNLWRKTQKYICF